MRKPWTNKCFLGKIWKPWNDKCYLEFGNNELTYVIRGRMETMDWQMLFGKSGNNELTVVIRGRMKPWTDKFYLGKLRNRWMSQNDKFYFGSLETMNWQLSCYQGKYGNHGLTNQETVEWQMLFLKVWKPWTD